MNENISWGKIVVLVVAIVGIGALGFMMGKQKSEVAVIAPVIPVVQPVKVERGDRDDAMLTAGWETLSNSQQGFSMKFPSHGMRVIDYGDKYPNIADGSKSWIHWIQEEPTDGSLRANYVFVKDSAPSSTALNAFSGEPNLDDQPFVSLMVFDVKDGKSDEEILGIVEPLKYIDDTVFSSQLTKGSALAMRSGSAVRYILTVTEQYNKKSFQGVFPGLMWRAAGKLFVLQDQGQAGGTWDEAYPSNGRLFSEEEFDVMVRSFQTTK